MTAPHGPVVRPDPRPWRLRTQLLGLVAAVAVPLIALGVFRTIRSVGEVATNTQAGALTVAELVAADISSLLMTAAGGTEVIASRLTAGWDGDCAGLRLTDLSRIDPHLASAFVLDATGSQLCSALPRPDGPPLSAADREYFAAALATDDVVFSEPTFGRLSGAWVVIAARKVPASDGAAAYVAGVSVEVSRFYTPTTARAGSSMVITVVDARGRIVARSLDDAAWIGQQVSARPVVAAALARGRGTAEGPGVDRVPRLWGFAPVTPVGWVALAGADASVALAAQRRLLVNSVVAATAVTLGVAALAWLIAGRITRPVLALSAAAAAARDGGEAPPAPEEGPAEIVAVAREFNGMVSARREAETALRASEAKFQRAFGASPMPMMMSTYPDGRVIDVNDACIETFGWSREEFLNGDAATVVPWPQLVEADGTEGGPAANLPMRNREVQGRNKNGETLVLLCSADHMALADRAFVVSLLVDITDRRNLEAQLQQAQKMEAIGQLTGGIAHDFNNLLTAVLGNAELLAAELPPSPERLRARAQNVTKAAQSGATLVKRLMAFARRERLVLAPLDLNEVCRDTVAMIRHLIPETIEIRFDPAAEPVWVKADRGAVGQILLNLATNARDAMPEGGALRITVGRAEHDATATDSNAVGVAGTYGRLQVTDSGVGMTDDVKARVFEPFFTTKPIGEGTGLGMSSVYGLVKQHAGDIQIQSAPYRGTTTTVLFPATASRQEAQGTPAAAVTLAGGGETVLLVEDNAQIREVAELVLARHGYRVLQARDGDEALWILQHGADAVHLVMTDVVMPNRGGPALLRAARALGRRPRFLFTSGYADLGPADLDVIHEADFIAKPWSVEDLLSAVRRVLDREGPTAAG